MLSIGEKLPSFCLKATVATDPNKAFIEISDATYKDKWLVIFFWPKDFTFVCPTEIIEFNNLSKEFVARDAQVLGVSIDSEFVHLAWRSSHPGLSDISFPMLSDIKRELCSNLGILNQKEGIAERATFIVDPEGYIRFISVTDLKVGRNVHEILRVLDALQTDELCPCNWQKGQATLR